MINSELKEYMEGVISHYSSEYPYYFMATDTSTSNNYWQQYGATLYLSKSEPTVNSMYSMTSEEWLAVTVYSSNASNNDHSKRVNTRTVRGTVTCNEWEYVYSNVESTFAYSSVDVHVPDYFNKDTIEYASSIIMCACLLAGVIGIWFRR